MLKTITAAILATSGQSATPVAPAGKPCSNWVTIGTATEKVDPVDYTEIYRLDPDAEAYPKGERPKAEQLTCDLPICIQVIPIRENGPDCRAQDQ